MKEILDMTDQEFKAFHKSHKGHKIIMVDTKFLCSCEHIFSCWDIWTDIPKRLSKLRREHEILHAANAKRYGRMADPSVPKRKEILF